MASGLCIRFCFRRTCVGFEGRAGFNAVQPLKQLFNLAGSLFPKTVLIMFLTVCLCVCVGWGGGQVHKVIALSFGIVTLHIFTYI